MDLTALTTREIERMSRQIRPGEWAVEKERPISTLLGSCVAVCLYDTAVPIAGMNHFMLPRMRRPHPASRDILLAGEACMAALLEALLEQGASKSRLQAKAFGGGCVVDIALKETGSIGKLNTDFTREWLLRENIPLTASDFLGPWSRKVLLVPPSGAVYCKRQVSSMINAEVLQREEQVYTASLRSQQQGRTPSHG
ncbi:chemotaxis protein CheD [Paludibacterium yongneupense]|uniref:chemotaxis protein CheD n=1 Tax=Paludibacterium yongneupense TaxID=400061 RepID=UPI0004245EF4|nr:chemotaxis protein CheD [Paludibacterium yongneupense]